MKYEQIDNTRKQTKEFLDDIEDIRKRCDTNTKYISDREQVWSAFQKEVINELKEIKDILKPIAETYNGITFFGNWGMKFLVTLSVISGLIWGWFEFVRRK